MCVVTLLPVHVGIPAEIAGIAWHPVSKKAMHILLIFIEKGKQTKVLEGGGACL